MSSVTFFGVEWESSYDTFGATHDIFELHNKNIGKFFISKLISECSQEDWYKIIALIHEKTIFNEPYFIVSAQL